MLCDANTRLSKQLLSLSVDRRRNCTTIIIEMRIFVLINAKSNGAISFGYARFVCTDSQLSKLVLPYARTSEQTIKQPVCLNENFLFRDINWPVYHIEVYNYEHSFNF